jgi:agmatinase
MLTNILAGAALVLTVLAHEDQAGQLPIAGPHKSLWYNTLPGDGGTQVFTAETLRVIKDSR